MAVYGHPDSGTDWEHHCDQSLQKVGFRNVGEGAWPSCYDDKELGLLISVYVDDFNKLINTPGTTPGKQFKAVIESKYTHYKKTYKGEE